jgi:hypothetical protein
VVKVLIYIQMLFIFLTPVLIIHLWNLKTVVFLHWCLIRAVLLNQEKKILCNWDIEFFNFRHLQVQKCKILNQSECDQNFEVNFQNHQKQKQKLTKLNKIKLLFCENLLDVIEFHEIFKISQFVFNSVKVQKIFAKWN